MNQNTKHKYVCMYHPLVESIFKEIEYAIWIVGLK